MSTYMFSPFYFQKLKAEANHNLSDTLVEKQKNTKAGWFKNGDLDLISSGMLRSSAQLFSIDIGGKGSFSIPLYLMVGSTTDIFPTESIPNETTLLDLLNSKGGVLNFGLKGAEGLSKSGLFSKLLLSYHIGFKSISGIALETNNQINFFSKMINLGMLYKSQAWQSTDESNIGVATFNLYLSHTFNDEDSLIQMIGTDVNHNIWGINFEGNIEVDNYLNLKFGYYKYLNNQHIPQFQDSVFSFAAHFNL
jgi:hypothetical protein